MLFAGILIRARWTEHSKQKYVQSVGPHLGRSHSHTTNVSHVNAQLIFKLSTESEIIIECASPFHVLTILLPNQIFPFSFINRSISILNPFERLLSESISFSTSLISALLIPFLHLNSFAIYFHEPKLYPFDLYLEQTISYGMRIEGFYFFTQKYTLWSSGVPGTGVGLYLPSFGLNTNLICTQSFRAA